MMAAPREPSELEVRNCRAKVRFDDKKKAKRTARRYGRKVYRCPVCHFWHLTSRRKRKPWFLAALFLLAGSCRPGWMPVTYRCDETQRAQVEAQAAQCEEHGYRKNYCYAEAVKAFCDTSGRWN